LESIVLVVPGDGKNRRRIEDKESAMRYARCGSPGQERPLVSGEGGEWRDARSLTADIDANFLRRGVDPATLTDLPVVADPGRFGPPIVGPGKIVCVGLNYRDHAAETDAVVPAEPILFLKSVDTIIGPDDQVLIPRSSAKTDWEVELAVVIGAQARYLSSPADSQACIAGYTISNDVSEREFQIERGGQWDKGKNCETFNPLGPWILSADEVPDPQHLGMRLSVNDVNRQDGNTDNMIFGVFHLVWYVSQFMVLHPGDIINTGTPAGVALGLPDHPYLKAGDVVEVEIDGLGRQRQLFVQA
jgi:2-keto-4-pentenoate hydratase/2-oxohepta-3-ene-1,7-dioic acid hydratase in catechol pathway